MRPSVFLGRSSLFLVALFLVGAASPPDFRLDARSGSYAPWGSNALLSIDAAGNVVFMQSSLDSAAQESIAVMIPADSVGAIYDTVLAAGFADLDTVYNSSRLDGSGIFLRVTAAGQTHAVESINSTVPGVDRVVRTINRVLSPYGITLRYESLADSLTN
jgi:hypothetical protein